MLNAFQRLSLPESLVVDEDTLRAAFREAGRVGHPDSGGGDAAFAEIREAFELLSSPSRRLRHWLELRGIAVDERGVIDATLMGLFDRVGSATQQAEKVVRRRDGAKSALVRAMLEGEVQQALVVLEQTLREVDAAIAHECAALPLIADRGAADGDLAARVLRHLRFLEKWRTSLRSLFPRLL
jgi:curved DNA-binding protein CbpA